MTKGWSDYELEGRSKPKDPERHKMQDSVDEMCRIMKDEHERFSVSTHTVDFDNGIELWRSDMKRIWAGRSSQIVFTESQARQLRDAFVIGMKTKKTQAQEEIERRFLPREPEEESLRSEEDSLRSQKERDRGIGVVVLGETKKKDKKWWEFWK